MHGKVLIGNENCIRVGFIWVDLKCLSLTIVDSLSMVLLFFLRQHFVKCFIFGKMLKGGGSVADSSKYDIHNFVLANFHSVSECCSIIAYELDIYNFLNVISQISRNNFIRTMAIRRFNKTITLITEYEPNMRRPQKRV